MALAAGQGSRLDLADVFTQRFIHVLMGHNHLSVVPIICSVAGIAADGIGRLRHHFIKRHGINAHTLFCNQLMHIRRLAGQAVSLCMRPLGFLHVFQCIGMTPGAAVILGKAVSFINIDQIRILLQIVSHIAVILFFSHGDSDR